jgi:peptidoglycan/xylan/chitin deacetylase (PgdA/CDA1 family)
MRQNRYRLRRAARNRRWQRARMLACLFFSILLAALLLNSGGGVDLPWPAVLADPAGVDTGSTVPESGGAASAGTESDPSRGSEPDQNAGQGSEQDPDQGQDNNNDEKRLKPNELGQVMIIMYHDVQDYESEWVRSRENLRADLERFYNLGYTLVPLSDYLSGHIEVPAGRSPLVLTFDDGTRGQLSFIEGESGRVLDPNCAVGILLEFSEKHPDFGHAATFFVNSGNPFGDASRAKENLRFLLDAGMEIGNHTRTHRDLSSASPEEVAKELGSLANEIRRLTGYEVTSLALPFGGYPKSKENLLGGTWEDQAYHNLGVLLVGAEPAPSPFSTKFNPYAIPRIRGSQSELDKWLNEMEKHPERRYVSDGQADIITYTVGDEVRSHPLAREYRLAQ